MRIIYFSYILLIIGSVKSEIVNEIFGTGEFDKKNWVRKFNSKNSCCYRFYSEVKMDSKKSQLLTIFLILQEGNDASQHKSLSTSDLMSLFEDEKSVVQYLTQFKNQTNNSSKLNQVIDRYISLIDYDM